MDTRKIVFKETAIVFIGQLFCVAAMLGIYGLLGYFNISVLWGGVIGGALSVLNFFFMAIGTSLAADKAEQDNVKGGKALIQSSYFLRMVVLAVVLFACIKSGFCDTIALLIPLVFVRPIIMIGEFFRKSGDNKK